MASDSAAPWLATERIIANDAIILSGDGGGGKTTIALQLAVSVAGDLGDWLGTTCQHGAVLFFSAEEPEEEMRRRLQSAARARGLEEHKLEQLHFHFAEPDNCLLGIGRPNGPVIRTPLFEARAPPRSPCGPPLSWSTASPPPSAATRMTGYMRGPSLVFSASLPGKSIAPCCCSTIRALSGITSGTGRGGSMDWQNATRGRMYLETVTEDDAGAERVLTVKKTNYGKEGERILLRWQEGCFIPLGTAPPPQQAAAERKVDELFLRLLEERNAQARYVTPSKAVGYAPKELSAMPGAAGVKAPAFAKAMERLLSSGQIIVETFGYASRQRQRLVPTTSNRLPTGE